MLKKMPFPQTTQQIYDLTDDDIKKFAALLKTTGLRPPLPKQDSQDDRNHAVQNKLVRDDFICHFPHLWSIYSISGEGWQTWSYNTRKLDGKICLYTKKLGHILNKLAEFNDNELTKNFVERIAENLRTDVGKATKLLQKFHIFTKTPSTSRSQILIIPTIEECVSDLLKGVDDFAVAFYREECVSLADKPYISGFADGVIVITNKRNGEKDLIIVEYDGIVKTPDRLLARQSRYLNVDLNHDRFEIGGEEFENVKSIDLICGNNKDILREKMREKLYAVFIKREAIPTTAICLANIEGMQDVLLYKGLFQ
jgi:hypothetical protein